ncbi:MAG: precorrin-4 C(11)-methyltransferase, partial [Mesorhizobium sp.]
RILTGTLGTIEAQLAENPMERTAIIFVGSALAAQDFGESSLYDAHYQRRFRGRDGL